MPVRNYELDLNDELECYDLVADAALRNEEPASKVTIAHIYDGDLAIRIKNLLQDSIENNLEEARPMSKFEKLKKSCPWMLSHGSCAATYRLAVKCSEAHCAPLFWLKQAAPAMFENKNWKEG